MLRAAAGVLALCALARVAVAQEDPAKVRYQRGTALYAVSDYDGASRSTSRTSTATASST